MIGAVLRFPENRKFPSDFELEVDDLMRSILEGRAMDAKEKRIDNLLGGHVGERRRAFPRQSSPSPTPTTARTFPVRQSDVC